MEMSSNHPRQRLVFYVAQDFDDSIREAVKGFVHELAGGREWVIRPPKIVDTSVEAENPENDAPVLTLGGYIELYSALPGTNLPKEVDLQHLKEVEHLVEQVRAFSEKHSLAFEFELNGTFVGSSEDGILDRTLKVGLLGEWRKHLSSDA